MKRRVKKIAVTAGAGLLVLLAGVAIWLGPLLSTPGAEGTVRIPPGSDSEAIADSLRSAFGPRYARGVVLARKLFGGTPEKAAGLYTAEAGTPAWRLARRLQYGRQTPVRLTFNNIRTLEQLAERIGSRMAFGPEDFLAACDSVLPGYGFRGAATYPAAFIPDTYEFYWTTGADAVVRRLADERMRFWTAERRDRASALGLNPVGVATVASIVEEETAAKDERPAVARLYINRLARGMKLQADPTVKFATGDFSLRRITGKHLATASAYNTYIHAGLPPGPIRIPERSTLEAVLTAPAHDYIYMCARPDFSGRHNFAGDYATHERNARAYRKALDSRGIK